MFIHNLLIEYKKRFGFKQVLIRNILINKLIIIYLLVSVLFPIITTLLFIYHQSIIAMLVSIFIYAIVLNAGGVQHKKKMIKAKPPNSLSYDTPGFKEMLREVFSISSDEQYLRLDELIKRHLSSIEYTRKNPLFDIGKQLMVALIVTGLLSYAIFELREGNIKEAQPLLALYLLIISAFFAIGGIYKQLLDFGSVTSLNDISVLIQLVILENSIRKDSSKFPTNNELIILPPRKTRFKA